MKQWLIDSSVLDSMREAQALNLEPTAEQKEQYMARFDSGPAASSSRLVTIAGGEARVSVEGTLTQRPSLMAMLFGGGNTTYEELSVALAELQANDDVETVALDINSPGGQVMGLFDALADLEAFDKPLKAVVSGMATSAAYAIAAQADEIVATGPAAMFGSVGIMATLQLDDKAVTLTSTNAPKKAPDASTEEGRAEIVERLDALHDLFAESIADGRGISAKDVNKNFGKGATLLAGAALERGMIDSIKAAVSIVGGGKPSALKANSDKETTMNLAQLKAEHPDVYAAAVSEGVTHERDRVTAHLTLGQKAGAMDVAVEAIEKGDDMTATRTAQYLAAGMDRSDTSARTDDDASAAAAVDGASDPQQTEQGDDHAARVLAVVESQLGVQAEA